MRGRGVRLATLGLPRVGRWSVAASSAASGAVSSDGGEKVGRMALSPTRRRGGSVPDGAGGGAMPAGSGGGAAGFSGGGGSTGAGGSATGKRVFCSASIRRIASSSACLWRRISPSGSGGSTPRSCFSRAARARSYTALRVSPVFWERPDIARTRSG
ncbi:MAG: hypothetical protein B7X76_08795 [Azorhizobium sp. 39-67-5]|nr:MAG: hypothetical protein B7X76_08795 [Azorhizobium sp. 39-67-5]